MWCNKLTQLTLRHGSIDTLHTHSAYGLIKFTLCQIHQTQTFAQMQRVQRSKWSPTNFGGAAHFPCRPTQSRALPARQLVTLARENSPPHITTNQINIVRAAPPLNWKLTYLRKNFDHFAICSLAIFPVAVCVCVCARYSNVYLSLWLKPMLHIFQHEWNVVRYLCLCLCQQWSSRLAMAFGAAFTIQLCKNLCRACSFLCTLFLRSLQSRHYLSSAKCKMCGMNGAEKAAWKTMHDKCNRNKNRMKPARKEKKKREREKINKAHYNKKNTRTQHTNAMPKNGECEWRNVAIACTKRIINKHAIPHAKEHLFYLLKAAGSRAESNYTRIMVGLGAMHCWRKPGAWRQGRQGGFPECHLDIFNEIIPLIRRDSVRDCSRHFSNVHCRYIHA